MNTDDEPQIRELPGIPPRTYLFGDWVEPSDWDDPLTLRDRIDYWRERILCTFGRHHTISLWSGPQACLICGHHDDSSPTRSQYLASAMTGVAFSSIIYIPLILWSS